MDFEEQQSMDAAVKFFESRERSLDAAVRLFESQPDFASVQVWMPDRMVEAEANRPTEAKSFGTKARADFALAFLNIRADAFLKLVSNAEIQNAYMTMVEYFGDEAWREFTGFLPQFMEPVSDMCRAIDEEIQERRRHWIHEGYKRVAAIEKPADASQAIKAEANKIPEDAAVGQAPLLQTPPWADHANQLSRIEAFISKMDVAGHHITRTNIWKVAGYKDATEFQRFQRGDPRTTRSATGNFNRVLLMSPEAFMQALEKKKPLK